MRIESDGLIVIIILMVMFKVTIGVQRVTWIESDGLIIIIIIVITTIIIIFMAMFKVTSEVRRDA